MALATFQQRPEARGAPEKAVASRQLICIAKGRDGLWEAICLDFDIAVAGDSLDDVKGLLYQAVYSYCEDAKREAEPTRSQLLNRRVPFWARLRWTWPFVLAVFFGRKQQDAQ